MYRTNQNQTKSNSINGKENVKNIKPLYNQNKIELFGQRTLTIICSIIHIHTNPYISISICTFVHIYI